MSKRGQAGRLKKLTKAERAKRGDKKGKARDRRAHQKWADEKVVPGAGA